MKKKERHLQWERENERRRVRREELEKELHRQVVLKKGRKLPPRVAGVDEEKAGGSLEREEDEGVEGGAALFAEIPPGSSLGERRQEKPACDQDQRGKGLFKGFKN